MDWITILIFIGFFLTGVLVGLTIGFALGQRHVLREIDCFARQPENILEAEVIE